MAFIVGLHAQDPLSEEPGGGPPPAPEGFKWVANEKFSDEFNGTEIDLDKWYPRSPYWIDGRPPATFRASNVSVGEGCLKIKASSLPEDEVSERYQFSGAAVSSRARDALYGYYSVRMKASGLTMSSTFWLKNQNFPVGECGRSRQELDIVEAVGKQTTWDFRNYMRSNTHYGYIDCDGKRQRSVSAGGNCEISPPANEAFHVYGCWWKDANTLDFYHNGEYKFTINPSTKYDEKPYRHPMYMMLVVETYNWERPPLPDELADDSINTCYYDWVRSYKLVPVD